MSNSKFNNRDIYKIARAAAGAVINLKSRVKAETKKREHRSTSKVCLNDDYLYERAVEQASWITELRGDVDFKMNGDDLSDVLFVAFKNLMEDITEKRGGGISYVEISSDEESDCEIISPPKKRSKSEEEEDTDDEDPDADTRSHEGDDNHYDVNDSFVETESDAWTEEDESDYYETTDNDDNESTSTEASDEIYTEEESSGINTDTDEVEDRSPGGWSTSWSSDDE